MAKAALLASAPALASPDQRIRMPRSRRRKRGHSPDPVGACLRCSRRPLNGFHLKSSCARTKKAGSSSFVGVGLSSVPRLGVAGSLQLRRSISATRTAMAALLCFLGTAADHSSFAASIVAIDHHRRCADGRFFFDNAILQLLVLLRKSAEKSSAPAHGERDARCVSICELSKLRNIVHSLTQPPWAG